MAKLKSGNTNPKPEHTMNGISEHALQQFWRQNPFIALELQTTDRKPVEVVSPGWWNHGEGPDFKDAQLKMDGEVISGDIEIHIKDKDWRLHGHHQDHRYNNVVLHVVLFHSNKRNNIRTANNHGVPLLVLNDILSEAVLEEAVCQDIKENKHDLIDCPLCATMPDFYQRLSHYLDLFGEFRMMNKTRMFRERVRKAGPDQALYELLARACGYGPFKQAFERMARQFPYDRVRQLALQDPVLLEASLLQLAGLVPAENPSKNNKHTHWNRITALLDTHMPGLRSEITHWPHTGVRPNNRPERRLAGLTRLLSRTANKGLSTSINAVWEEDGPPLHRRRQFETLFPRPVGYWAWHSSWHSAKQPKAAALIGPSRQRSIIGNVFIPVGFFYARANGNRTLEEQVHHFYNTLPGESENIILKRMVPRIMQHGKLKMTFKRQQGLLHMYEQWCGHNPSCHQCSLLLSLQEE